MDGATFLKQVRNRRFFDEQIAHVEALPARPAAFGEVPGGIAPTVANTLRADGIEQLYSHQAEAIGAIRGGADVVPIILPAFTISSQMSSGDEI